MKYLLLPLSYFLGSFPTGLVIVYLLKKVDVRDYGSGNIGATNVARVVGKKWAAFVFAADALKGALCTWLGASISSTFAILCGLSSIVGHNWSIYLKGRGGKGVATTAGVVAVLTPLPLLLSLLSFSLITLLTRYVSLGSLSSALFYVFMVHLFYKDKMLQSFSMLLCAMIFLRHAANIKRLLKGREHKF